MWQYLPKHRDSAQVGEGDRAAVKWQIRLSFQLIVHLWQCCNENPLFENHFCMGLLGYTSLVCTCLRQQQCPSITSCLLTEIGFTGRKLRGLNFPFSLLNKTFFINCWHVKYQHWALSGTSLYSQSWSRCLKMAHRSDHGGSCISGTFCASCSYTVSFFFFF